MVVTATDRFLASANITVTIDVEDISLGTIGDRYDADQNEVIDRGEALLAINDYLDRLISREDVFDVIELHLFG